MTRIGSTALPLAVRVPMNGSARRFTLCTAVAAQAFSQLFFLRANRLYIQVPLYTRPPSPAGTLTPEPGRDGHLCIPDTYMMHCVRKHLGPGARVGAL